MDYPTYYGKKNVPNHQPTTTNHIDVITHDQSAKPCPSSPCRDQLFGSQNGLTTRDREDDSQRIVGGFIGNHRWKYMMGIHVIYYIWYTISYVHIYIYIYHVWYITYISWKYHGNSHGKWTHDLYVYIYVHHTAHTPMKLKTYNVKNSIMR